MDIVVDMPSFVRSARSHWRGWPPSGKDTASGAGCTRQPASRAVPFAGPRIQRTCRQVSYAQASEFPLRPRLHGVRSGGTHTARGRVVGVAANLGGRTPTGLNGRPTGQSRR